MIGSASQYTTSGAQRFSESELKSYDGEFAIRYAKLLRSMIAERAPDLRTLAKCAAGLARAELGLDEDQSITEIGAYEHRGTRGFASLTSNAHRIFVRLHDQPCACRVAITVLHECRHRFQVITERFIEMYGHSQTESDAQRFADSIMRKYHFVCGGCGKTY
jgi:hypothetical protein